MKKFNESQLQFMARAVADLDWQKTCSNENPYNEKRNPIQWQAYEDYHEELALEWDHAFGGAA